MHILRQQIERIEGFQRFVEETANNSIVQGIVLDINPAWFFAYRLARAGLNTPTLELWPTFWQLDAFYDELFRPESFEGDGIDFNWIDKTGWVKEVTNHLIMRHNPIRDSMLPFISKVIAKPIDIEHTREREDLVGLASSQDFAAIVETRPFGKLAVSPGDQCLANGLPGTIGGFLRNHATNNIYASTCGHVVTAGTTVTVFGNKLGVCSYSHAPVTLSAGQSCTPACTKANKLDLALIDVGNANVSNSVSGIATQIAPKQRIILRGGMSGVQSYEVGGMVMTYCPGSSNVCFKNLFEVRPISSGLMNSRVQNFFAAVPLQGDSGGWLETVSSTKWCGVLVATDSLMGYALEADDSINEANAIFGMQLQLA